MKELETSYSLPLRTWAHNTIIDALVYASQSGNGFNFYNDKIELTDVVTYKALLDSSYASSRLLKEKLSGNSVAIFAETSSDFVRIFLGCQFIKVLACPVSFQIFSVKHNDYVKNFFNKLLLIGIDTFVVPDEYLQFLAEQTKEFAEKITIYPYSTFIENNVDVEYNHDCYEGFNKDEDAYIQLTSGSTSLPKALLFSQKNLAVNIKEVHRDGMALTLADRSLCWLPFSHSIAMVGFMIGSIYCHRTIDFFSPADFLKNPLMWLELISRHKVTLTCCPSFGYQMLLDKFPSIPEDKHYDLSSLRSMGIGGDMVKSRLLSDFSACFKKYGFEQRMFNPCYGLTESTLAIAHHPLLAETIIKSVNVDGGAREVVCSGLPHNSFDVLILNNEDKESRPNEIGEILVSGPAIVERELSGNLLPMKMINGKNYLDTGDLGFLDENGYLYVTGRKKDIVIVRGKNISLVEIDELVSHEIALFSEKSAAFIKHLSIFMDDPNYHSDKVLLIVETSDREKTASKFNDIKNKLKVMLSIDLELVCVAQDFISLTSSGKFSREETKQKLLNEYKTGRGQHE